jgi:hypothetical protein
MKRLKSYVIRLFNLLCLHLPLKALSLVFMLFIPTSLSFQIYTVYYKNYRNK